LATITSPVAQITSAGIKAPAFSDILAFLQAKYQGIFGADVYLGDDSQEGQFLSVIASLLNDQNALAIAIFNSFSPSTATSSALSSNVKINGLSRAVPSFSTCDILCTGVAGTTLVNVVLQDVNNIKWSLPPTTIPTSGQVTATATCTEAGDISALPNTITTVLTPVKGLQSVTNLSQAAPGEPVESDSQLRVRQAASTAIPSLTVLDGIVGSVSALTNVSAVKAYVNETSSTDANGVPANAISLVVQGGDASAVASAISLHKTPGVPTYGTTSESVTDKYGTRTINFFRPTSVPIAVTVTITALNGYNDIIGGNLQQAVVDYVNGLGIGNSVRRTRLFTPASLYGAADSLTYEISNIQIAGNGVELGDSDITISFNELATCQLSDVTLTVES
jgi:uncharacterized phage protein gp47/JayE